MTCDVFLALPEEINAGWVWLSDHHMVAHSMIRVRNTVSNAGVICECRQIDEPFRAAYNKGRCGQKEIPHPIPSNIVVISDWYRTALGIGGEN